MEIKVWKIVDGKRAWVLLRVLDVVFVGPVFSTNFWGNNPWTLSGRRCPFIGRARKYSDEAAVSLFTFGPVAVAMIVGLEPVVN